MGQLIPVMCDEVVPGDVFRISNELVIRFNPILAPILHEINAFVHYFFVPYRILWDDWETFITRGLDGDQEPPLPRWSPGQAYTQLETLWDYFGFPVDININPSNADYCPVDFPKRAYNMIWNEYYRDRNIMAEQDLLQEHLTPLRRCWEKDYFTSSLPWQQRGTAPALPITGVANLSFPGFTSLPMSSTAINQGAQIPGSSPLTTIALSTNPNSAQGANQLVGYLNSGQVDFSNATTFDVSDLRLAFQVQRWMELNARAGNRYTEFLKAHFPASPRDDRLQRPEYIGGSKSPIIISEVLQTAPPTDQKNSPQGNMAGHGMGVDRTRVTSCRVQEFGLIIGLLSVMPRTMYDGLTDRQWLRETTFDYYFPEFQHLSEQAIEIRELYSDAGSNYSEIGKRIFGYQGRYNEMRSKHSQVCGKMRTDFQHWHLARTFETEPALSGQFLECNPRKNIFAVTDEPGLIVHINNRIRAVRPMTAIPVPGLIDH